MTAEQIVRALAAIEDPTVVTGDPDLGLAVECGLCGAMDGPDHTHPFPEEHEPTCPWRLAVQWVAANPEAK